MNLAEAQAAHKTMLDLRQEVLARLPPTITTPHWWEPDETLEFELYDVDLDTMTAIYRMYIGRGEYEIQNTGIDLTKLFQD